MKTELEKCLEGEIFNTSDAELQNLIHSARRLTKQYNQTDSTDVSKRQAILGELFERIGTNVTIDTPFYCDYGKHISVGNNVIININCTFVDCNRIKIGNNVLIASNVQIYTATHPVVGFPFLEQCSFRLGYKLLAINSSFFMAFSVNSMRF